MLERNLKASGFADTILVRAGSLATDKVHAA